MAAGHRQRHKEIQLGNPPLLTVTLAARKRNPRYPMMLCIRPVQQRDKMTLLLDSIPLRKEARAIFRRCPQQPAFLAVQQAQHPVSKVHILVSKTKAPRVRLLAASGLCWERSVSPKDMALSNIFRVRPKQPRINQNPRNARNNLLLDGEGREASRAHRKRRMENPSFVVVAMMVETPKEKNRASGLLIRTSIIWKV